MFPTLTLTFRANADGAFVAHHYRYAPDMSTFILECDAPTWDRSGLAHRDDEGARRYCEAVFAPDLGGHPLVSNRSEWLRLPRPRLRALEATRTSSSSATPCGACTSPSAPAPASRWRTRTRSPPPSTRAAGGRRKGLERFEAARRPVVDKLLAGAAGSWSWYERFADRMHLSPHEFAYDYMTRSGRVSDERLRAIAPRFARRLAAARRRRRRQAPGR